MRYLRIVFAAAVLLIVFGVSKIAYDAYTLANSTTSSTTSTSTTTTSTSSTTTSTTTSSSSTSTTTYLIVYTTTMWGNCNDDLKNQNELGVDCGGLCKPCRITCTKNDDCGKTHEEFAICIENEVYRPLVKYDCLSPWEVNSTCRIRKDFILVDHCGASEGCVKTKVEAECVDKGLLCTWTDC